MADIQYASPIIVDKDGNRPMAPIGMELPVPTDVTLDRHHILPYFEIRDAWNRLVHSFENSRIPEARVTLQQFAGLTNDRTENVESLADDIKHKRLNLARRDRLVQGLVWAPWNIVFGPKNRSDDPKNRACKLDLFKAGVTSGELGRMAVIERLHFAIDRFNNSGHIQAPNLTSLAQEIRFARNWVGTVQKPITFRPGMWEKTETGQWRKRRTDSDRNQTG